MNFPTLLTIGILVLLVGGLLIAFVKKKINKLPKGVVGKKKVTTFGFIFAGVFVFAIVCAFSSRYVVSELSEIVYALLNISVLVAGVLVEKLANKMGFKLLEDNNDLKAPDKP